jgi:nucleoside-diphosphate-sugar epimerase
VHCSTVGVHGDVEHAPADEDAPLKPGDIYQATKLAGERASQEAAAACGVELVIARPTGIYGPGDRRLLKLFRGVARRRFVVLGSGRIFYHLTYIDDLVDGFRLCGEVPGAAGRTYILAGAEVTTLNELVERIAGAAGVAPPRLHLPVWPFWAAGAACEALCAPFGIQPPLYRRRVDFFTKSRAFDITRARRELGYSPAVPLDEGIRRTLAWYRDAGWI